MELKLSLGRLLGSWSADFAPWKPNIPEAAPKVREFDLETASGEAKDLKDLYGRAGSSVSCGRQCHGRHEGWVVRIEGESGP